MTTFIYTARVLLSAFFLIDATIAFAPRKIQSRKITLDMVARNPNFAKLAGGYLFPEIGRRRSQYVKENPEMADRIVSLGIGDTTEPIPPHILSGLVNGASKLGTKAGYTGYGDVQGRADLCTKIAETLYNGIIDPDEVFVSGTYFLYCSLLTLQNQESFLPHNVPSMINIKMELSVILCDCNKCLDRMLSPLSKIHPIQYTSIHQSC
jgi:hypothetical protein